MRRRLLLNSQWPCPQLTTVRSAIQVSPGHPAGPGRNLPAPLTAGTVPGTPGGALPGDSCSAWNTSSSRSASEVKTRTTSPASHNRCRNSPPCCDPHQPAWLEDQQCRQKEHQPRQADGAGLVEFQLGIGHRLARHDRAVPESDHRDVDLAFAYPLPGVISWHALTRSEVAHVDRRHSGPVHRVQGSLHERPPIRGLRHLPLSARRVNAALDSSGWREYCYGGFGGALALPSA
jgi:hypothetical protein